MQVKEVGKFGEIEMSSECFESSSFVSVSCKGEAQLADRKLLVNASFVASYSLYFLSVTYRIFKIKI